MLELILLRHGETDSNLQGTYVGWTDISLNKKGVLQAEAAAERLAGHRIDRIFSSPLKRAFETAMIVNGNFNLPIEKVDELKERNFGIWENLMYREIQERYPDECAAWTKDWLNYCIPGGESAADAFRRNIRFVDALVQGNASGTFLIVTHLGCIRTIITYLLGMKIEDIWRFSIDNCGITKIMINDEKYAYMTLMNG